MKIVIAGGTGLLGAPLVSALAARGDEVRLLSRRELDPVRDLPGSILPFRWDGTQVPAEVMEGADAVVNLAGEPIGDGRWTRRRKRRIIESRVGATRAIVEAMRAATHRPAVLINASAVGFYGDVPNGEVNEDSPPGTGFVAETVGQWEAEASAAKEIGVRVVALRTGVVLAPSGGILERLTMPFKLFVGGPLGPGTQWVSWIHLDDALGAVIHCLERTEVEGPVNIVAPDARTMRDMGATIGRVLHRPFWFPVPGALIRLVFGEMADVVLHGQHVVPGRLVASGFVHRFPRLLTALIDLLVA